MDAEKEDHYNKNLLECRLSEVNGMSQCTFSDLVTLTFDL